jgi:hypothetical protein
MEIKLSREKSWRSSYQEGRGGDQVIKREGLEIKLSRGKDNLISNPSLLIT